MSIRTPGWFDPEAVKRFERRKQERERQAALSADVKKCLLDAGMTACALEAVPKTSRRYRAGGKERRQLGAGFLVKAARFEAGVRVYFVEDTDHGQMPKTATAALEAAGFVVEYRWGSTRSYLYATARQSN